MSPSLVYKNDSRFTLKTSKHAQHADKLVLLDELEEENELMIFRTGLN